MKKILIPLIATIANVLLFVVLLIAAQFTHFFVFGEGNTTDKYSTWVVIFFAILHLLVITVLFSKRILIGNWTVFMINAIAIVILYIYVILKQV